MGFDTIEINLVFLVIAMIAVSSFVPIILIYIYAIYYNLVWLSFKSDVNFLWPKIQQAGIELGLNQAETVSLELPN